jgi:hypothetical protein
MYIKSPDVCYKGSRTYVHGTTLYEEILLGAAEMASHAVDGPIRIDIRGLLSNQGDLHFQGRVSPETAPEGIIANFSMSCGEQSVTGWVTDAGKPVSRRIAYDESVIKEMSKIEGNQIFLLGDLDFTPFEICASMAVKLHNHLAPPVHGTKWLLTRIEFDHGIVRGDLQDFSLKHIQTIANRFTKTEVHNADGVFGRLFFSLGSV